MARERFIALALGDQTVLEQDRPEAAPVPRLDSQRVAQGSGVDCARGQQERPDGRWGLAVSVERRIDYGRADELVLLLDALTTAFQHDAPRRDRTGTAVVERTRFDGCMSGRFGVLTLLL